MGLAHSSLNKAQLRELEKSTNFAEKELKQWHRGFIKDCPSGQLTKQEFVEVYSRFFPAGESQEFSEHVFSLFDHNKDGQISFKEFIIALSITSRGEMGERLKWTFSLYDKDGDGEITRQEMLDIVTSIYKMTGPMVKLPEDEDTPEKRVTKLFSLMDKDENGSISFEEFEKGCQEDKTIADALNKYTGLV